MAGRRKIKKEAEDPDPEFQVAPMVDVLLVLLIFFMSITSTELLRSLRGVDLPSAKNAADKNKKTSQVVVNIGWDAGMRRGLLVVEEQSYDDPQAIIPLLQSRLNSNPTLRVLIRADRNSEYNYVAEVMRACSMAQISSVTFSVVTGEIKK